MEKEEKQINTNMQFVRFVAACLVIISHAHSLGKGENDWIGYITNRGLTWGSIAVSIFFALSGFFMTKSVKKYENFLSYMKGRIIRIFPSLLLVVFCIVLVLGPIFTTLPLNEYFSSKVTWLYFLNAILIPIHDLPGVFENCIALTTVNGALWTLSVEFLCYIALWIVKRLGLLEKKKFPYSIALLFVSLLTIYVGSEMMAVSILKAMMGPIVSFYIGVAMQIYNEEMQGKEKVGICIAIVVLLFSGVWSSKLMESVRYVIIPYMMITLLSGKKQISKRIAGLGNWSYGMYLTGFPIQQMLISLNGGEMNPYANFICAIPLAMIAGFLIFLLCENMLLKVIK